MLLQLDQLSPNNRYFQISQTLLPRPIAWVLTGNESGTYNLAPFSYFTAICSDPALVMISLGKKQDGSMKDTRRNIERSGRMTIHIASSSQLDALNRTAATLDAEVSELDGLDLELVDIEGHPLPRIEAAPIAYACELYEVHEVGNAQQAVIYCKVNQIHIDDEVVTVNDQGRIKVHPEKVRPLARLGASEYLVDGEVVSLKRPA